MIKIVALTFVVALLSGCSSNAKHFMRVLAECHSINDRTCEANQQPEYRTDSLNGPTVVIIKYE